MFTHVHTLTLARAQAGANMIVSGSAVVKSSEPAKVIKQLRESVEKCLKITSVPPVT